VNAIKNGWEETDDAPCSGAPTSGMDESHMEQGKSDLNICTVFHAWQLLQKSESLQPVFTISCQQPGETRVCAKWIWHVFNNDQRTKCVLLATTHLHHWRNEGSSSLGHVMADESWMHSFDTQLK